MRFDRAWMGVAGGMAVGLAITAAVGANAQSSGFTVSAQQLKINQNISSAAVKRSNRSLNYLAPIRTTQTDNADNGSNGVKPLSSIPGSGQGWTVGQIAPGQKQYWANVSSLGALTASSGPASGSGAFTATRSAAGNYVVDFKTNISACSWDAAQLVAAPPPAPALAYVLPVAGQPTQVDVRTITYPAGAAATAGDANFTVRVLC
jgi:hypothetical protein